MVKYASQEELQAARRLVERRLESLRAVEDAPNRGQWDYPTGLRLAQERLDEAREALRSIGG
jgi:hypothetical protein